MQRREERQGSEQGDLRDGEGQQGRWRGKLCWFPGMGIVLSLSLSLGGVRTQAGVAKHCLGVNG